MAQKNTLKFAESVLIPIIISQDGTITVTDEKTVFSTQERKQAFLVHLQIGKMAVTVYTSKAFAEDGDVEDPEPDANLRDTNSDELNESGDEFQIPQTSLVYTQDFTSEGLNRTNTQKLQPIGETA